MVSIITSSEGIEPVSCRTASIPWQEPLVWFGKDPDPVRGRGKPSIPFIPAPSLSIGASFEDLSVRVADETAPWDLGMDAEMALLTWQTAARTPVMASDHSTGQLILRAIESQAPIEFAYLGGANPGTRRRIWPKQLFRVKGYLSTYMSGFCETRQAERTFRVGSIKCLRYRCAPLPWSTTLLPFPNSPSVVNRSAMHANPPPNE